MLVHAAARDCAVTTCTRSGAHYDSAFLGGSMSVENLAVAPVDEAIC